MSNKYTEENLIRAASYLPSEAEKQALQNDAAKSADPLSALLYADDRETVLYGIFGDVPDYSNPDMEALWDEVLDEDPEDVYEYCFRKGVDLFQDDGKPVPGWRDVAVMLKAIDKGILELA
ncbi:MAG TPA: hypothetical protein DD624_06180 [Alphaproteobacteria bacterium]|nr:hypothetical protein [Alphaproteobacteria bacterium]